MHPFAIALGSLAIAIVFLTIRRARVHRARLPSLPGPKGWPLIGNLLDMPTRREWLKYSDWRRTYGDVYGLKVLGQSIVVLNSVEAIETLLEKRNSVYSDRPRMTLLREWCQCDWFLTALPYGDAFHSQRKVMNQHLNPSALKSHHDLIQKHVLQLAGRLLSTPGKFQEHHLRMVGSISLMITYGHKVENDRDSLLTLLRGTIELFAKMSAAGAHPVDLLPSLKHLPLSLFGTQFAKDIRLTADYARAVLNAPFDLVKKQVATGVALDSIVASHLRTATSENSLVRGEDAIKSAAAMIYLAGADTTVSSLDTFIIAMMLYPSVQAKARVELDAITNGGARLPTLSDRESCTYLDAVLKELHRWNPVGPLALPHSVTVDDEYKGMLIPRGSVIIANTWEILHDPQLYPDPSNFNPERFLKDGLPDPNVQDPKRFAFGYGRRICPGRHMAEAILWISMATLLTVFEISLPVDQNGAKIYPDLEFESSIAVSRPKPFKAHIVARSSVASGLVHDALRLGNDEQ